MPWAIDAFQVDQFVQLAFNVTPENAE